MMNGRWPTPAPPLYTPILTALVALAWGWSVQAGVDDLRVTEVDPVGDQVEITHFSTGSFATATSLPFCHRFNYASSIPSATSFGPGQSKTFTVTGLNDTDSDIWLYRATPFDNGANIISGIKYGPAANVGRTGLAAGVGLWPSASAFVPAPAAGQTLQLRTDDPTAPENWASAAATPNAYFGTGTALADPLPDIPKSPTTVGLQLVASGLSAPLGLRQPDDGSGRLFIYDQTGTVHIVSNGVLLPNPFLDVSSRLVSLNPGYDERGFLGMACHPGFATNGLVYTYTSEPTGPPADFTIPMAGSPNHHSVVAEWKVSTNNPNAIEPTSRRELLRVEQPQGNHNAGEVVFGPDGLLYIALGDGGSSNDGGGGHSAGGNGQDPSNILGSILRIDPGGTNSANGQYGIHGDNPFISDPTVPDETWAYGFRNPYRISFDRVTGDLYVGDVGQNDIEEVTLVRPKENHGWRLKEGSFYFDPTGGFVTTIPFAPFPPDLVDPLVQYDHDDGVTVIGGYTYEGSLVDALADHYVFGDFGAPWARLLAVTPSGNLVELTVGDDDRGLGFRLKGMGRDLAGELYLLGSTSAGPVSSGGAVYRLIPLLHLSELAVDVSDTRIGFVSDSSVTSPEVQYTTDLANPGTWSNLAASITGPSNGVSQARFETLPDPFAAFRVVD